MTEDMYGAFIMARNLVMSGELKSDFSVLIIDTSGLELYQDPFSVKEGGFYSVEVIEPNRITNIINFSYAIVRSHKNWKRFWDWWFWKKTDEKPEYVDDIERYKS